MGYKVICKEKGSSVAIKAVFVGIYMLMQFVLS